ncbi:MgtC/SapB family protein [Paenibacillus rhizovicinus]|uniref:MgtC/SapB family protein n=1 Tax=Paenibacillus rhizovicinus TaxID=2704463 RepID=A0A6C0P011_9BACL|nr:MgtC/SapB family protein [Paenibacillus rhizovicinus]QHW31808.1 MgtC/SapB family protein [Paenibacillus rhizovicinus]
MEYELLLRVIVAGACGLFIGYERKSRMKEAGIRTHFVVATGAALMMVISKYGFKDMQGETGVALDPSRIAAQVVSGVGFLGAGMIFMQRQTVKGLTTAAGMWATAGIGMAIGANLYLLGIGVTLLILVAQKLLHSGFGWLSSPRSEQMSIRLSDEGGAVEALQSALQAAGVTVLQFQAEKHAEVGEAAGQLQLELTVRITAAGDVDKLLVLVQRVPQVIRVEMQQA